MKDSYARTWDALRELADFNSTRDWIRQVVHPPELPLLSTLPTLDGERMPLSPMLHARYEFCGRWEDADLGHTWLGNREMIRTARALRSKIRDRVRDWPTSRLARAMNRRTPIALFGVDAEELDETYLIWGKGRQAEPMVVAFSGHNERAFSSLLDLLEHCLNTG